MVSSVIFRIGHTGLVFLSTLLVSRLLLPADFGMISLLLLNASLLNLLTGFGSESMLMYRISNQQAPVKESAGYMFRIIRIQMVLALVLQCLVFLLFQRTLFSWSPMPFHLLLEMLFFSGIVITDKVLVFFYAHLKSLQVNRLLFGTSFLYLFFLLLLFFLPAVSIDHVFILFSLYYLMQGMALLFYFRKTFGNAAGYVAPAKTAIFLKQSWIIIAANVLQLLAYRIDIWIIGYYYSFREVGQFSLATKFANLIWIVPNLLVQLIVPFFGKLSEEQRPGIFRSAIGFNLLLSITTAVLTIFFYMFYIGAEYQESLQAFYWMLPGYFCWAGVIFFAGYFAWKGAFIVNLYASAGCMLLILLFDLLLIPRYSYFGAAMANTIVYSLVFVFYLVWYMRTHQTGPGTFFNFSRKDFLLVKKLARS